MKLITRLSIVVLVVAFSCTRDEVVPEKPETAYTIEYKGVRYRTPEELQKLDSKGGYLFNDYVSDPQLDYMFDTEDELLAFAKARYSEKEFSSVYNNIKGNPDELNARTLAWGVFNSVQWTDGYCNEWANLLCNAYPDGSVKDFSSQGCEFPPISFNAAVPSGESITLTYYKFKNYFVQFPCPSSYYRSIYFSAGSHCYDVKFMNCSFNILVPGQALSAKWTSSN